MEIQDYPNYLIYENGEVWSKNRNKFMAQFLTKGGYKYVLLFNNGKQKHHTIHRLLAIHYIKNPDGKLYVDHKDRNRTNNNLSNLIWATSRENNGNTCNNNEYIGVLKHRSRYRASIKVDGKAHHLGTHDTPQEASIAYQKAVKEVTNGEPITPYTKADTTRSNKYKYVYKDWDRYAARPTIDGKKKHLGMYATPELARDAIINHMNHLQFLSN